ncbi:MAG: M10 family metallopeptidase C-terminal domain-containing protein [Alphaproteobacteria bacterium]|nr:M10 family metallopeptidase C-terminal domain-containing protein [Alphaproteobacteria bacterium]
MDQSTTKGCGCSACQSGKPDLVDISEQDFQNIVNDTTFAPSGEADPATFANYLTHGFWQDTGRSNRSWAQDNVTYSLSNEFSAQQQAGIRMAFDLWSDVADISFTEVDGGANITILEGDDGRAYSSSSTSGTNIISNTISIDTNVASWSDLSTLGDYGLMTALHEIGHSLGLGHTGNYNGSATYGSDAQWTNDSHQMTVMSYLNATNVGSDHWNSTNAWQYSATPMLIDIVAIQNIYGANYSTRSGNTTYGFNSNAGRPQFDFSVSEVPIAIWDGGGIDTIDLSGYSQSNTLYLTEGDFSSVGSMTNNLVIAYGVVIENAVGGTGSDTIYGNNVANNIDGNSGNDSIHGSLGNDTINGGLGTDSMTYNYTVASFSFNFIDAVTVIITHLTELFTDTITAIENFIFTDVTHTFAELDNLYGANVVNAEVGSVLTKGTDDRDRITGNNLNETLKGFEGDDIIYGQNGSDIIYGQEGDDTVYGGGWSDIIFGDGGWGSSYGGNDTLYGEAGNDRVNGRAGDDYIDGGTGHDVLYGNEGADEIYGGSGADLIFGDFQTEDGSSFDDELHGGNGNDTLTGGGGNDTLYGDGNSDTLKGGTGNDHLEGGADKDLLFGGDGSDTLIGGTGYDVLYGEGGSDVFGFTSLSFDKIKDFTLTGANRDSLNITDVLVGYNAGVDDIDDFVILDYKNANQTNLFINANGSGGGWTKAAEMRGSDFAGTTVDDLVASGQLITDTTLL